MMFKTLIRRASIGQELRSSLGPLPNPLPAIPGEGTARRAADVLKLLSGGGGGGYDPSPMRLTLAQLAAVAVAGAVGAVLRVVIATAFARVEGRFPYGILLVNVSGSFVLGWFATYALRPSISDTTRLALGAGFVGAYTTFSTLMLDTTRLVDGGEGGLGLINLVTSIALGLLAVRLGMMLGGAG